MSHGLIIAGFHRSGTSAVSQNLQSAGLFLGSNLLGAADSNSHGHFEDLDVIHFHEAVLADARLDWATPFDNVVELSSERKRWIAEFIESRGQTAEPWGFKDPRVCHFLDYWKAAFSDFKTLIVFRHPASCAQSLHRRHAIALLDSGGNDGVSRRLFDDVDLALKLWLSYNRRLVNFAQQYIDDTLVVSHSNFARGAPIAELLSTKFGFQLAPISPKETFDESAVSELTEPLNVVDRALIGETLELWEELRRLEVKTDPRTSHSTTSELSLNDFRYDFNASSCDAERRLYKFQNEILLRRISKEREHVHNLNKKVEELDIIRNRVRKFPFNIYFSNKKKYRIIIN